MTAVTPGLARHRRIKVFKNKIPFISNLYGPNLIEGGRISLDQAVPNVRVEPLTGDKVEFNAPVAAERDFVAAGVDRPVLAKPNCRQTLGRNALPG